MTLTIDLPEELASRLTASYPEEAKRNQLIICSIADVLESKQQEADDLIASMDALIADVEAGRNTYSFEEVCRQWDEDTAARLKAEKR